MSSGAKPAYVECGAVIAMPFDEWPDQKKTQVVIYRSFGIGIMCDMIKLPIDEYCVR